MKIYKFDNDVRDEQICLALVTVRGRRLTFALSNLILKSFFLRLIAS